MLEAILDILLNMYYGIFPILYAYRDYFWNYVPIIGGLLSNIMQWIINILPV